MIINALTKHQHPRAMAIGKNAKGIIHNNTKEAKVSKP